MIGVSNTLKRASFEKYRKEKSLSQHSLQLSNAEATFVEAQGSEVFWKTF